MMRWAMVLRWGWGVLGFCAIAAHGFETGDYEKLCGAAELAFQHGRIEEALKIWDHVLGYPDDFKSDVSDAPALCLVVARHRYTRLPDIPREAGRWEECKRIVWYISKAEQYGNTATHRQAEELIADFNEGEEGDCYQEALVELSKESQERRASRIAEAKANAEAECARLRAELDVVRKKLVAQEGDSARLRKELLAEKNARLAASKAEAGVVYVLKAQLSGREVEATIVAGMQKNGVTTPKTVRVREGQNPRFRMEYMEGGKLYTGEVSLREKRGKELIAELSEVFAGNSKKIMLTNGVTMDMVWCPQGSFWAENPDNGGLFGRLFGQKQKTEIAVDGFWIAKTEITQKQWRKVMGNNPSKHVGADKPVEGVGLDECREFCRRTGLALPTEAQWEYACRAGSTGDFGGTGRLSSMGWYEKNSDSQTHSVGGQNPNDWGLFDMHGNVWEWCENGAWRGGSWHSKEKDCRSGTGSGSVHQVNDDLGFRPIMEPLSQRR